MGDIADNNTYVVTVTVKDSSGASNTEEVTVSVTNVPEEPGAPAAPTVVSTDSDNGATTYELKVVWYPPEDTVEALTGYSVEYKKTTETSFGTTDVDHIGTATSATISELDVDTSYPGARAGDEQCGRWSLVALGRGVDQQEGQRPARVRNSHRHAERVGEC